MWKPKNWSGACGPGACTGRSARRAAAASGRTISMTAGIAAAAARAGAVLLHLARFHVVDVAGREHVVRLLPGLIQARVVVHRDLPRAHHLEAIALHDDRCGLGQPDAEQRGVLLDDGDQVVPAVPRVDVLIDGD